MEQSEINTMIAEANDKADELHLMLKTGMSHEERIRANGLFADVMRIRQEVARSQDRNIVDQFAYNFPKEYEKTIEDMATALMDFHNGSKK